MILSNSFSQKFLFRKNRNLVFNDNIFDPFIKVFEKNVDHPKINRVGYPKSRVICSFEIEKCKVATEI